MKIVIPLVAAESLLAVVREDTQDGGLEPALDKVREIFTAIVSFKPEDGSGQGHAVATGMSITEVAENEIPEGAPDTFMEDVANAQDEIAQGNVLEFDTPDQIVQWMRERL